MAEVARYTIEEWRAEAVRRFGDDEMDWRFICPACGYEAPLREWKEAGAPSSTAGFSCVGRWDGHMDVDMGTKPGPCNYAGGGLFGLNPVTLTFPGEAQKDVKCFAFAEAPE